MSMEHPGKRVNNRGDIGQQPTKKRPIKRQIDEVNEEVKEVLEEKRETFSTKRFKSGRIEIGQEEFPNQTKVHENSGREIRVESNEKSIEIHGSIAHIRMEETDTGGRRVTFPDYNDSQRFYLRTIEIGKDHPTARIGDFHLKHGNNDELEISTGENLGEQDKIIIRGFGEHREIDIRYIDKYKFGNNYDININSVISSKKATGEEAKKLIIEWAEKNYGKLFGGVEGVIRLVKNITGIENIAVAAPKIPVEA